jgi:hypothetical protein
MSVVVIEQIKGQSRDPGIRVELTLSTLPERDVSTGMGQRIARTLVPGNSTPTMHVLGAELQPITLRGVFDDGVSRTLNNAIVTVQQLEQMCREGYPVQVVWAFEDQNLWDYEGFITDVQQVWGQGSRVIGWSLEFSPYQSAGVPLRIRGNRRPSGADDINRQLAAAMAIGNAGFAVQGTAAAGRMAASLTLTRSP